MAPASRRNRASVSERLRREAHRFDFFQAVRVLECLGDEPAPALSGRQRRPVGEDSSPNQEAVRFRVSPSLAFPTGPIRDLQPFAPEGAGRGPPRLTTTFLGLVGSAGALPRPYSMLLIERLRAKDSALRDFLDIFQHRAISLFYRAWKKYRFSFSYEGASRLEGPGYEDTFTRGIYALVGLGADALRRRQTFDDEALLYYAGHFAHWPRCAVSLEILLADYFALPVAVRQFRGQWLFLSVDDQSSLPSPENPAGRNTCLGANVVAGERVWNVESKIRLCIGPLGYADFCRFLPSGAALTEIVQIARTYVGPQFDMDVQVVLKGPEAPWCRLGGDPAGASRLGWNAWVRCGDFTQDLYDAVFTPDL
jgi:type VI secretion system protein ImpH